MLRAVLCLMLVLATNPFTAVAAPGDPEPAWPPPDEIPVPPPAAYVPPGGSSERLPPEFLRRSAFQSVQVNVDPFGNNIVGDAANEPSIAVDPTDHNRLVIGWRQFDALSSNFREAGWAYSHDAGRAWTFPGAVEDGVFRSDPVLSADNDGNLYYYSLTEDFVCWLFKSTDGGLSWSAPVMAFGGDKCWMDIDRTGGPGGGNIYCFARMGVSISIGFTRSLDGGASFQPEVTVPQSPGRGTLAVGVDGSVYLVGRSWASGNLVCVKSINAWNPAVTPSFPQVATVNLGGVFVTYTGPNPGGLLGQVNVDAWRPAGASADQVYMLCSVDPPGSDPLDVMFVRSTDGGQTWGAPVRINDDSPGTNAWQWYGTMSVAPSGRIDVIWNDTRNGGGAVNWSEVYYSYSNDGGLTWSANEALTPLWDSFVGWPQQNKIGDYYHMRSDNVGADLTYAATFNGEEDIYYVRIGDYDCNGNGVGDAQDLLAGISSDLNGNDIPDECDGLGDLNCDGALNTFDIDPFVLALTNPAGYALAYPNCDLNRADINGDGSVNAFDIDPFVILLTGG